MKSIAFFKMWLPQADLDHSKREHGKLDWSFKFTYNNSYIVVDTAIYEHYQSETEVFVVVKTNRTSHKKFENVRKELARVLGGKTWASWFRKYAFARHASKGFISQFLGKLQDGVEKAEIVYDK